MNNLCLVKVDVRKDGKNAVFSLCVHVLII